MIHLIMDIRIRRSYSMNVDRMKLSAEFIRRMGKGVVGDQATRYCEKRADQELTLIRNLDLIWLS